MMKKIYTLCGVADTNVLNWLKDDNLLTTKNLETLHRYAMKNMKKVKVEADDRGFFHLVNVYWKDREFCHIHKRQAQYYQAINNGYYALFYKKEV